MTEASILVSWQRPKEPNGIIMEYTVYIKEIDRSRDPAPKSFKVKSLLSLVMIADLQNSNLLTHHQSFFECQSKFYPQFAQVNAIQMSYLVENLNKKSRYEFWVTAHTAIGEGLPSPKATISPSSRHDICHMYIIF